MKTWEGCGSLKECGGGPKLTDQTVISQPHNAPFFYMIPAQFHFTFLYWLHIKRFIISKHHNVMFLLVLTSGSLQWSFSPPVDSGNVVNSRVWSLESWGSLFWSTALWRQIKCFCKAETQISLCWRQNLAAGRSLLSTGSPLIWITYTINCSDKSRQHFYLGLMFP